MASSKAKKVKRPAAAKAPKKAAPPPKPAKPSKPAPIAAKPAAKVAPKPTAKAVEAAKPVTSILPARAPVRTPERAEELKAKIGALASATGQIRALKRTINRSFFDVANILVDIQSKRLFDAKGYGSFEAFVEREIELGKQMSLRLVRVPAVFHREAAVAAGLERVLAALAALDGDTDSQSVSSTPAPLPSVRSAIPPHKQ